MAKTKLNAVPAPELPDSFTSPSPAPKRKLRPAHVVVGLSLLIALGCAGAAGYFYWQLQQARVSPEEAAKQELASVKQSVGNLMVLPTDEEPTLATVADPEKLRSQPFFANAEAGDKVLIYAKAKKAILYRPSVNKILEVAPLNFSNDSDGEAPAPTNP